jgi:hypothetical protein
MQLCAAGSAGLAGELQHLAQLRQRLFAGRAQAHAGLRAAQQPRAQLLHYVEMPQLTLTCIRGLNSIEEHRAGDAGC